MLIKTMISCVIQKSLHILLSIIINKIIPTEFFNNITVIQLFLSKILSFLLIRKNQKKSISSRYQRNFSNGSESRIRTDDQLVNSQLLYRWATSEYILLFSYRYDYKGKIKKMQVSICQAQELIVTLEIIAGTGL